MMIVAVRGADGQAALGRAMGVRLRPGRKLMVRFSGRQWPEVAKGANPGGHLALTVVEPASYRGYQFKGPIEAVGPAGPAEEAAARSYMEASGGELGRLGVAANLIAQWFCLEDLLGVEFEPLQIFSQTPGPGAGGIVAL